MCCVRDSAGTLATRKILGFFCWVFQGDEEREGERGTEKKVGGGVIEQAKGREERGKMLEERNREREMFGVRYLVFNRS